MPTLRVELFEGRTAEQKRALAKELTDACVRVLGGSADGVDVLFFDIAPRRLGQRRRALVGQGEEAESDLRRGSVLVAALAVTLALLVAAVLAAVVAPVVMLVLA